MGDYSWIGPLAAAVGKGMNSYGANNAATAEYQNAFDKMLAELQARFGEYNALGNAGYKPVEAQQLGPSALESIPQDLQSRQDTQEAIGSLDDIANNGGLSLADMKAINDIQRELSQGDMARRKGLANEFAARGQLGSGAQLAMALQGQQAAAQNANQRAEGVQAQAQARAMQALLQKAGLARGLSADDYARKAAAAQARDAIEARNAAARTDAAKSNNAYAGQAFQDELSKMRGKTSLTNSMNEAVFGKGKAAATNIGANAMNTNGILDAGASAWGSFGKNNDSSGSTGGGGSSAPASTDDTSDVDPDDADTNYNDDD